MATQCIVPHITHHNIEGVAQRTRAAGTTSTGTFSAEHLNFPANLIHSPTTPKVEFRPKYNASTPLTSNALAEKNRMSCPQFGSGGGGGGLDIKPQAKRKLDLERKGIEQKQPTY